MFKEAGGKGLQSQRSNCENNWLLKETRQPRKEDWNFLRAERKRTVHSDPITLGVKWKWKSHNWKKTKQINYQQPLTKRMVDKNLRWKELWKRAVLACCGKGLCRASQLEFDPQNPSGGRRESTPTSCLLTSTHTVACVCMHTLIKPLKNALWSIRKKKKDDHAVDSSKRNQIFWTPLLFFASGM